MFMALSPQMLIIRDHVNPMCCMSYFLHDYLTVKAQRDHMISALCVNIKWFWSDNGFWHKYINMLSSLIMNSFKRRACLTCCTFNVSMSYSNKSKLFTRKYFFLVLPPLFVGPGAKLHSNKHSPQMWIKFWLASSAGRFCNSPLFGKKHLSPLMTIKYQLLQ